MILTNMRPRSVHRHRTARICSSRRKGWQLKRPNFCCKEGAAVCCWLTAPSVQGCVPLVTGLTRTILPKDANENIPPNKRPPRPRHRFILSDCLRVQQRSSSGLRRDRRSEAVLQLLEGGRGLLHPAERRRTVLPHGGDLPPEVRCMPHPPSPNRLADMSVLNKNT